MGNALTRLSPELQDALDALVLEWDALHISPEQQRQQFRMCETLLSEGALQMAEEGKLTPAGPDYSPEMTGAVLKLHLVGLHAMILKAHEERLTAEAIEPLLRHGAYRCLEQAKQVLKTHLEQGHPLEDPIPETEMKRFLTEAAVYALSYTIESYRQQKAQQADTLEIQDEASMGPSSQVPEAFAVDNSVFLKQLLVLLVGITLILFIADRVTASGLDGPMSLMCLMFALTVSFGYYFYQVLQYQKRELHLLKGQIAQEQQSRSRALPSLGVSVLEVQLGRGLEMLQATVMLPMEMTLFRTRLAEDLGLQLAEVPITMNPEMGDSRYRILLRGDTIAQGQVFPPRMMVTEQQLELANLTPPENSITALDDANAEDVRWVSADWPALSQIPGKPKSASKVIIRHLENVIFGHMDEIIGQTEIMAVIDRVRQLAPALVDRLIPHALSEGGLRRIWVNLMRERMSVKDVTFIFERLIELSTMSREPDVLSEQLRLAMARKLCQMHTDISGVMYVLVLSETWERRLIDSFNQPRWSTPFGLTQEQMEALAETTVSRMTYAENTYHCRPVLLCAPAIRMALFLFLNHYIPGISVLGHNELVPDTQLEVVGTIDADL